MAKKLAGLITLLGITTLAAFLVILHANPPSPEKWSEVVAANRVLLCSGGFVFLLSALIVAMSALFQPLEVSPEEEEEEEPAASTAAPEPKAEPKQEPKPEPKAEALPELKPEPKPEPKAEPKPEPRVEPPAKPAPVVVDECGVPFSAYQILYLFQKEGRLLDFLMEDISGVDDADLGGGIRPIHEGCRKILQERLIIEPLLPKGEGEEITFAGDIDTNQVKLTGNVPGKPPFKGSVVHRGWRLKECKLPELVSGWSGQVVAPGEVEIP